VFVSLLFIPWFVLKRKSASVAGGAELYTRNLSINPRIARVFDCARRPCSVLPSCIPNKEKNQTAAAAEEQRQKSDGGGSKTKAAAALAPTLVGRKLRH